MKVTNFLVLLKITQVLIFFCLLLLALTIMILNSIKAGRKRSLNFWMPRIFSHIFFWTFLCKKIVGSTHLSLFRYIAKLVVIGFIVHWILDL